MKKTILLLSLFFILAGCSSEQESNEAGNYTCSYGNEKDDIFVEVVINYNMEQYVTHLAFTQKFLFDEGKAEEEIEMYISDMNKISGVNADATFEDGFMRNHYTVNLTEYNTESDLLKVIEENAQDETLNMKQVPLKKALEKKEYKCQ